MTRTIAERIADILDAIYGARIADSALREAESSLDDVGIRIAFDAILRNLTVIGEAVKAFPNDVLDTEGEMPWKDMAMMRDVITHQYHRIDACIIHLTVSQNLDPLEQAMFRIRSSR